MASEAQIAANRRNAQLSTGPKTKRGQDKSRGNALRHGLYAAQLVAMGEADADFVGYCAALEQALKPQDAYEALLVRRVAFSSWRSDRLAKLEAALLKGEARREAWRRGRPGDIPDDVWPAALAPLARHEATLDRAIQRALTLLERYRRQQSAALRVEAPAIAVETCDENFAERSQIGPQNQRSEVGNEANWMPEQANPTHSPG